VSIDGNGNHVPVGSACARQLLNTLTASNSASLQDTTSLTSSYSWYEIVFENVVPASGSATFCKLQVYVSGYQSANYKGVQQQVNSTGVNAVSGNIANQYDCSSSTSTVNSSSAINGVVRIYNPSAGNAFLEGNMSYINSSGNAEFTKANVIYTGSGAAVTGFQVVMNSGNITSGVVKIYGNP
jgi:hypothetical protein